jgi:hypothetical protein
VTSLFWRVPDRPLWNTLAPAALRVNGQAVPGSRAIRDPKSWPVPIAHPTRARSERNRFIMCKVLNKHHAGIPAGAVYIGRGSKWGNPFRIGADGDRDTVIARHERYLAGRHDLLRALDELKNRSLVCYCAPSRCHGDLLLRLANAARDERIAWWRSVKRQA